MRPALRRAKLEARALRLVWLLQLQRWEVAAHNVGWLAPLRHKRRQLS